MLVPEGHDRLFGAVGRALQIAGGDVEVVQLRPLHLDIPAQ